MKKIAVLFIVLLAGALVASAQKTFLLKEASKTYDVKLTVAKCEDDVCEGAGSVEMLSKDGKSVQKIPFRSLFLELGTDQRPTANLVELYGENNSGVVLDDYNFDGREDLAVRTGNDGAYGGPSYDIFLASAAGGKFVRNAALTRLASENLGLFEVDKKAKSLETFTKSGCCWHETTRYHVVNGKPVKFYVFTEDATGSGGEWVTLTTKTLVRGRWKVTTKKVKVKDYYKEN